MIIIIAVRINAILYFIAVDVKLAFERTPAVTDIGLDVYNTEWRKETVFYTAL